MTILKTLTAIFVLFWCITLVYSQQAGSSSALVNSAGVITYNGNVPILKGFVVSANDQTQPDQNGEYFGYNDLKQMKDWGATAVRIHAIRGYWIMPEEGVFNLEYFQDKLDKYVQYCAQLELYCIIDLGDWHWSEYFGSGGGMPNWFFDGKYQPTDTDRVVSAKDFWDLDNPIQADNREWFIKWWEFIANRYKDIPWVLFSIYNEPLNPGKEACSSHDEILRISASYSHFMEQVYDTIRSAGGNQTIIVNQPFVWYQSDIVKVNREIVWDFHLYVSSDSGIDVWKNFFIERYERCVFDFGQPFVMLEMGIYPVSEYNVLDYETILKQQVDLLKAYGSAGWFWLEWGSLAGERGNALSVEHSENVVNIVLERM